MSSGLAELGRELCQEFDERQQDLKTLSAQTALEIKQHREHFAQQEKADRAERRAERGRLKTTVAGLLGQYREERKTMVRELRDARAAQRQELKEWNAGRGVEFKTWNEAVRYVRTIRSRG